MSRLRGVLADPLLSVVMPAFNEKDTIEEIIRRAGGAAANAADVVTTARPTHGDIPDGCTAIRIHALLQPQTWARVGASAARFEAVHATSWSFQDADLEYSPRSFRTDRALRQAGRLVYGSRFRAHRGFCSRTTREPFAAVADERAVQHMLTDMETCYKVMRAEVLRSMTLNSNGVGTEPELTAKIFKRGYRVYEVPITYDGRGYDEGKKIGWRDGVVALWVLLRYRFSE